MLGEWLLGLGEALWTVPTMTACSGDTGGDVGILTYLDRLILLSAKERSFKRFHTVSGATVAVVVFWPVLQIDIGTWVKVTEGGTIQTRSTLTMQADPLCLYQSKCD